MENFEYFRPESLEHASILLGEDDEAKLIAGGMTLLPTMKLRLNEPSRLVDLSKLPELRGVDYQQDRLSIGAMTRHYDVSRDPLVMQKLPALASLAGGIGDVQVRNRGTIGGSIANNDPSADYPSACLALDALLSTNKRVILADDFFEGLFTTALDPAEILTSVSFRIPQRAAYAKFRSMASGYAVVGVFVAQYDDAVRVAVTGAGADGVFRLSMAEEALAQDFRPEALSDLKVDPATLMNEAACPQDYRAHLIGVMTRRAVVAALSG
ncbi:FAD binding domain-containing protein [Sphingobium lactosutens]|uniref:FAD-binding PCMH-type domain-containing protein n=1 Tax=Sphingobium lactosutens DS20 TaxID=1331060 RepID=T0HI53_9SPHN|nr:FAD binding domain-containing protein [Sphingobium lactosutens]EQB11803.1 hypothetical protein RLDS_21995 [Sphingobium lactosutens DS20]